MAQLNDSYSELFEVPSSKEEGYTGSVEENTGGDTEYTWLQCIDIVSETLRISWHEVYRISVIEFLNILAYNKEKIRKEKEVLEKWRRNN